MCNLVALSFGNDPIRSMLTIVAGQGRGVRNKVRQQGMRRCRFESWSVLALVLLVGCGTSTEGPQKYPVSGTVLINDQPAERVAVQFHHLDVGVPGNLRYPTAVTDAAGRFTLSSNGDRDGAVAGDYVVTFVWLSSADIDARDRLGGALSKPEASEFRVSVPIAGDQLPPFSLNVPEASIRQIR